MPSPNFAMLNWNHIHTVMLDMDGTLLDLHYDNHFWQQHVPQRYAETHGGSFDAARALLSERYKKVEGTLDWYCVDYWTRELKLDIAALKQEVHHLISIHPHVEEFLATVRDAGKQMMLVTNAHGKAVELKLRCAPLARYFDVVVCSHDFGVPKENAEFWKRFERTHAFEKTSTLFVDDSLPVLRAAHAYGITHLRAVRKPDSKRPQKDVGEFVAIDDFRDLMPGT
jgi:putative hydrolase of the HAD superfamily